jgi:hypothetical protein
MFEDAWGIPKLFFLCNLHYYQEFFVDASNRCRNQILEQSRANLMLSKNGLVSKLIYLIMAPALSIPSQKLTISIDGSIGTIIFPIHHGAIQSASRVNAITVSPRKMAIIVIIATHQTGETPKCSLNYPKSVIPRGNCRWVQYF